MQPSTLLDLAADLLRAVLRFDQPAHAVLATYFRQHRTLGPRDRHALAETAYAVLRRRLLYEHLAQHGGASGALERRLAMLAWHGRQDVLRSALGANDQDWLAQAQAVAATALPDPLRHNLPDWLADALQRACGDDFWPLADALLKPAPLDLRVNPVKARREAVQRALADCGITADATPYSPWGLRVHGKPALQTLDAYAKGHFEVQDEGSQLLALLTDPKRGDLVVDFCAGAGGKTLALGAAMRGAGRLYAFDVSGHRLDALKPRLAKSGLGNVYPVQIAHERDDRIRRLAGKIDRVLVDAPCSGLGTLRRHPDLKWRHSQHAVQQMQALQRAILSAAAMLLKPGGRLVYSTCSLLRDENDDVVADFEASAASSGFVALDVSELLQAARVNGTESLVRDGRLRMWPHLHATDGFCAAAWQRR